jgi:hypothetical protein
MSKRFARHFTVEEARALVPRLRGLLTAIQAEKPQLDREAEAVRRFASSIKQNGHSLEALEHERRMSALVWALRQKLQVITELGVEVKDLDLGLIDFPSLRDGREVYLCWRVDEPTVAYWHELDAGYRGRQPLE